MKKISIIAVILAVLMLACSCGTQPDDDRVVLKLGGEKIVYDYYRYVFLNTRDDMDGGESSYWSNNYEAQLELNDQVLDTLLFNRAIELMCDEYDIELTDEQQETVDSYLDQQKESLGDNYESSMAESYLTEYMAEYLIEFNYKWQNLYEYVTDIENGLIPCDTETLKTAVKERFRCIYYVMVSKDTENALDTARTVVGKAKACSDLSEFRSLITEYCDDENMLNAIDNGYYFVEGEIISDVEEAVSELQTGELSDIIDTDLGYFIIMAADVDENYISENYDSFETKYLARVFNDMVEEKKDGIEVEYKDLYSSINVYTFD